MIFGKIYRQLYEKSHIMVILKITFSNYVNNVSFMSPVFVRSKMRQLRTIYLFIYGPVREL